MSAWARSKEPTAPKNAERILLSMENDLGNSQTPNPNAMSYSSVIDALAKSKSRGSAKRSLMILERMKAREKNGDIDCRPTIITYNLLLSAFINDESESIDSVEKCMCFIERMYKSKLVDWDANDISFTFSTMLNLYKNKYDGDDAIRRAESVLGRMKALDGKGLPAVYSSILNVFAESGVSDVGRKGELLLKCMTEIDGVSPDLCTYNSVLKCLARSSEDNKASRAYAIFGKSRHLHSNSKSSDLLITYNTLLACCMSFETSSCDPFEIALEAYKDVRNSSSVNADHITYSAFLKVCGKYLESDKDREIIIQKVFKSCCKEGHVSNLVLKALHGSCSEDMYCKLLEGAFKKGCVNMNEIPLEWTCNVPQVFDRIQEQNQLEEGPAQLILNRFL